MRVQNPHSPSIRDSRKKIAEVKLRGIEAQWKVIVDRVRKSGALDNCLAICDVSGSMGSLHLTSSTNMPQNVRPISPAVALSLVLAQLAKLPFANSVITFSVKPEFVQLNPTQTMVENILAMTSANWSTNTAFHKVFLDLLLPLAFKRKLRPEDMIKCLYVFPDMQFTVQRCAAGDRYMGQLNEPECSNVRIHGA